MLLRIGEHASAGQLGARVVLGREGSHERASFWTSVIFFSSSATGPSTSPPTSCSAIATIARLGPGLPVHSASQ